MPASSCDLSSCMSLPNSPQANLSPFQSWSPTRIFATFNGGLRRSTCPKVCPSLLHLTPMSSPRMHLATVRGGGGGCSGPPAGHQRSVQFCSENLAHQQAGIQSSGAHSGSVPSLAERLTGSPSSKYVVYATACAYKELYGKITDRKKIA